MLLEAPSRPAWDSGDHFGCCWGRSPSNSLPEERQEQSRGGGKRLPASHVAGRSCSQPEDEESSVQAADPSLGSKAAAWQRRRRTSCTKAGEQPQVLLSAFPQGALPFLRLGSATGHSVDRTPSAPMGAATQHGDPNPSAPGTFAIPSSSLQVISHFFPYHRPQQHRCHHIPARSSCLSPAPSVGS